MGFSFSPQFSQRWANTSRLIRQAIATELSDIIRLLQPETNLNEFRFTHPDLIAYIDKLEADLDKQSQRVQPVPQSATPSLPSTQRQVDKTSKQSFDKKSFDKKYPAIIAYEHEFSETLNSSTAVDNSNDNDMITANEQSIDLDDEVSRFSGSVSVPDSAAEQNQLIENQNQPINSEAEDGFDIQLENVAETLAPVEPVTQTDKNPSDDNATDTDTVTNTGEELSKHEAMIAGLEMRIDDYLADNMARMSEDLKHWLRDEVKRQLAE